MSDELIRAELFSAERLEQHAQSLAAAQPVVEPQSSEGGGSLARRLRDNSRLLVDAHQMLGRSAARGQPMTPAAEWLVDNYHVIHAQVRQIRDDLPPGYYRQLPKLAAGPFAGFPRVLGIAWAFVAHTDSRFDPKLLCQFVRAYQRVQPLTIGELWASAITLRIVLVENLARAAKFIVENRAARDRADMIADEILGINVPEPVPMPAVLQEIPQGPLHPTFAVQLVQRLRDQDPQVTPALQWLDRRLAAQGDTGDAIVAAEHQIQAAVSVTVRNVVTSLRMISAVDWAELFEDVSLVDELLREDSDFSSMDFATRNRYRTAIEELARGSGLSELHVARDVLQMRAARVAENTAPTDPGHWLIGAGRAELEAMLGYRAPLSKRLQRASLALGLRRLPRRNRAADGLDHRAAGLGAGRMRARRNGPVRVRAAGVAAGRGRGRRAGEPPDRRRPAAPPAARHGAARRHPARRAHDGRGADAARQRGLDRGAGRASGNPPPRQPRRAGGVRAAHRLDRRVGRDDAGRRRTARRRGRRDRPAQPAVSAGRRQRAVPAVAPAAAVEPGAAPVDGLGAQARQAARTQPAAARRHRHRLPADRRRAGHRSRRHPLRHHARLRYPAAARSGAPAGRQDGAPAEPPACSILGSAGWSPDMGCCSRASRRRCRSAPRRPCINTHSPAPAASIRTPPPRRTSTRTCSAKAPSPARASTTSTCSRRRWPAACRRTRC